MSNRNKKSNVTKGSKSGDAARVPHTYITKAATVRLQYTHDHYTAFSCYTHDLKECWLLLPASEATSVRKVVAAVQNFDLYHADIANLTFQAKKAVAARVNRKGTIIIANGWANDNYSAFVLSDRVFQVSHDNSPASDLILACPDFDTGRRSNLAGAGTLPSDMSAARKPKGNCRGWKGSVAPIAAHSSLMMTAIAASFAAPLLGPMDMDPFIIYLAGSTSRGKSFTLLAAGSVIGLGKKKVLPTWKNTDAGLEEWVQLQYADMAFPIDELSHVGSETKVFEKIDEAAYLFDAGVNKKKHDRTTNNQSGRPRRTTPSNAIAITSYERTLAEIESIVGRQLRPGVRVRIIEIPASVTKDAEGVFDRLPKAAGVGQKRTAYAQKLTEELARACAANNGKVFAVYIKRLLADLEGAKAFVATRTEKFATTAKFDRTKGEEYRRVKHFAFLYGAGAYAIELGLLPWSRKQLLRAIRTCYRASRASAAAAAQPAGVARPALAGTPKDRLLMHLSDPKRVAEWPKRGGIAANGLEIDGWKHQEGRRTVYRVKASAIKRWFPEPEARRSAMASVGAPPRSTQLRIPGSNDRVQAYKFSV